MKPDSSEKKLYNRDQIRYFSSHVKPTMVPGSSPYIIRQINELISYGDIKPSDRVLEVGCGMGRYTLNLAERGFNIEGLDLTGFLLDKLKEFNGGRYRIPLHCADIADHPADLNDRFDAIIGFFTLHHLHDIPACFRAMYEMVKPGGSVIFLEPNAFNPLYYLQILLTPGMTWNGDRGIVKMRKRVIFDAMRNAGFSDLRMTRFGFFPPFISNHKTGAGIESMLERVPLCRPFLPFQLFKGQKIV